MRIWLRWLSSRMPYSAPAIKISPDSPAYAGKTRWRRIVNAGDEIAFASI
jgi:hypothetical protein